MPLRIKYSSPGDPKGRGRWYECDWPGCTADRNTERRLLRQVISKATEVFGHSLLRVSSRPGVVELYIAATINRERWRDFVGWVRMHRV
jgi:hypothetical protein